MNTSSELLDHVRCVIKLFESSLDETCTAYGLSHLEADILAFLKNNPNWDTARDISEYRMIPKANVSLGIDSLFRKNLLVREQDSKDRRLMHLRLTPQADAPVHSIGEARNRFFELPFQDFSEEEKACYIQMNDRILCNAKNSLERTTRENDANK